MEQNVLTQLNGNMPASQMGQEVMGMPHPEGAPNSPLEEYMKRHEFMVNSLNSMKAERESRNAQIDDFNTQVSALAERIGRQEGAVLMLQQIIQEIDPQAFSRQAQAGQGG